LTPVRAYGILRAVTLVFAIVQIKRSRFFLVEIHDEKLADVAQLLRGEVEISYETRIKAISMLTEAEHVLSLDEVRWLYGVSAHEWTHRSKLMAQLQIPSEVLDSLVEKGLLVSTSNDEATRRLKEREEAFEDNIWHPYAAFYHLMTKHPAGLYRLGYTPLVDMESASQKSAGNAERNVDRHGDPPPPFHDPPEVEETLPLPRVEKDGALYETLMKRRTGRAFDATKELSQEDFVTLLHYVGGCHGFCRMSENVTLLKRTSPSGGSLHPIEIYPLVLRVEGFEPGLYHYNSRDHALGRLRSLPLAEAAELAGKLAADQLFAGEAHLIFLMTARFERNFWKYRNSVKTHSVILLEAGHLSQTFQLVCSDLGLSPFFVGMDAAAIDEALGIDGITEGAVGLAGCGVALAGEDYGLHFEPYVPGETKL
jgi:putative peptide maturation dehydrogenase